MKIDDTIRVTPDKKHLAFYYEIMFIYDIRINQRSYI
jgi:hypothetical protein